MSEFYLENIILDTALQAYKAAKGREELSKEETQEVHSLVITILTKI